MQVCPRQVEVRVGRFRVPRRDKQHNPESAIWADSVSSRVFKGLGLLVWSPYPANSNLYGPRSTVC